MKHGLRLTAWIIALTYSISTTVMFTLTFLAAYFSPDKAITVTINSIGEADFELAMIFIGLPFALIFWFVETVEEARNYRRR